ncbi:hypothetical protein FEE96_19050 [Parasedimentitalea maritima]|uniref:Uncharacterized protein n=1 Tax=Parasedimentitalea maritima TaxID=2578117 RepID=A0ABY2UPY8_9RHOB|nr:hypothetical protein [Zongyanglinia marina]TLP57485.1 hypothetical protein FEE96_19050 [Zongyanglinia marina]
MEKIFNSMRDRMPWPVARVLLRSLGLEPSQGWQRTIKKYADAPQQKHIGPLLDKIEEHNLCGEKFTKIYEIEPEEHRLVQNWISGLEVPENLFTRAYPLTLPANEIDEIGAPPQLVSVVRNDDGIGAVYTHVIRLTTREKIELGDLVDDPSVFEDQYDEIIGLKYRTVQLFSIAWVPHDRNAIEIRTDMPAGMSTDFAHAVQSQIRRTLNDSEIIELNRPIDLFPLLEAIYEDSRDGLVVELGFSTTSASVKNEKMRRAGLDLRTEPYHLAGKKGLGTPIEPFRLFVRWTVATDDIRLTPELGLVGTARGRSTIGEPGKVGISGAIIRNCVGRADFEYVISRMHHHLESLKEEVGT